MSVKILDCTLRDGGYYNNWDFNRDLIYSYLYAMDALDVDYVEIGFRSLKNEEFKGGLAFSTDGYINSLSIPAGLKDKIGVMINGSEISDPDSQQETLNRLFAPKSQSPVALVRIACHVHEFISCLQAVIWLKEQGYKVGINLMQVADRDLQEIMDIAKAASEYPIDVLYFADSMGSLNPDQVTEIVSAFKQGWPAELGIHAHDNLGQALANTLRAIDEGVIWTDCTVTGMGRGPGNTQTEYLAMALVNRRSPSANPTKLLELIRNHFKPMQHHYGWGTNPFYYLAGKHEIHPTYIQEMLQDSRYNDEEILAVIDHLKVVGGKKFSFDTLDVARHFYTKLPLGTWEPKNVILNQKVLILGNGPSMKKYRAEIESFIEQYQPYVIALNTQKHIDEHLIHARAACHPVRLLADYHEHRNLSQPLITPASMLPSDIRTELKGKRILDFGLSIIQQGFVFHSNYCELPSSLVIAYALAITTSGGAEHIYLAGFDGYGADDPRRKEMDDLFKQYSSSEKSIQITSITPTRYEVPVKSIYGMLK